MVRIQMYFIFLILNIETSTPLLQITIVTFLCFFVFSHVIIVGDVNTSHRPIDHCDPTDIVSKSEKDAKCESIVF